MRNALVLVVVLVACGPSARDAARRDEIDFRCRDRIASYLATKSMAGDEVGVQLDCREGPRVKRWKTARDGKRIDQVIPLTPAEFDKVWKAIDGTGWQNMRDCVGGGGGTQDPVYVFDIKDEENTASFSCQSVAMPYPYDQIVNPLDMVGLSHKGQLGDDEPEELKKLDKRDMQQ